MDAALMRQADPAMQGPPPAGHNLPAEIARLNELLESFAGYPARLVDPDTAAAAVLWIKQATMALEKAEAARKAAKAPHVAAAAAAEAPYREPGVAVQAAKTALLAALLDYMQASGRDHVASEYGPKAHLRDAPEMTVDPAKVDLRKLRRFLDRAALEKAARAAIKAGVTDIRGVTMTSAKQAVVS